MNGLLVAFNAITVIFAMVASILSVKLIRSVSLGSTVRYGWWSILPFVTIYALFDRIFVLLDSMGYLGGWIYSFLPAIIVPFYIGFVIFLYGMNQVMGDIIRVGIINKEKSKNKET